MTTKTAPPCTHPDCGRPLHHPGKHGDPTMGEIAAGLVGEAAIAKAVANAGGPERFAKAVDKALEHFHDPRPRSGLTLEVKGVTRGVTVGRPVESKPCTACGGWWSSFNGERIPHTSMMGEAVCVCAVVGEAIDEHHAQVARIDSVTFSDPDRATTTAFTRAVLRGPWRWEGLELVAGEGDDKRTILTLAGPVRPAVAARLEALPEVLAAAEEMEAFENSGDDARDDLEVFRIAEANRTALRRAMAFDGDDGADDA